MGKGKRKKPRLGFRKLIHDRIEYKVIEYEGNSGTFVLVNSKHQINITIGKNYYQTRSQSTGVLSELPFPVSFIREIRKGYCMDEYCKIIPHSQCSKKKEGYCSQSM